MQSKRIKGLITLAILLVVGLLVLSTYLAVTVSNKKKELARLQAEISRLDNQLGYYENQQGENPDDKNSDIEVIVPGEE